MILKNLRGGNRAVRRLYSSSFSIDTLNEIKFKYKTTSEIPIMKQYQENGEHLMQSRVMDHVNKKKKTPFLKNPKDENLKKEQELVNKLNAGPSHDVFFNNNQSRDSIIELKILDFNNNLDSRIRTVCENLVLSSEAKTADISALEETLSEANRKDLRFIESNEEIGYKVDKIHKYNMDGNLFMSEEFTLLFHYKMINNQNFNIKSVFKKFKLLNTDLKLDQILYIINNLTKIGRLEDVKLFLEVYYNTENIDLDGLKSINLAPVFFYKHLNYDSNANLDENMLKVEILDTLIKIYYETNDYKYLKDLIRLRERLGSVKLVDNSTMFIRIMSRIMGNYNPYYIVNICNDFIRKQNVKYEPLDKMVFYKLLESMIKIDDPYLLASFIEQWEPLMYKGSRIYLDPLCIVLVERFKQTLVGAKYQPKITSSILRQKINFSLAKFNNFKTNIKHFKVYKHMSTLLVNFENDLHHRPITSVTTLLDRIGSNKYCLDSLAVSYFVNNILKISSNNITGMPNLVSHLFNCKVKSYNGIDLLDYSYYLIKTEYYKNRYEIFMNFFKYKPELVYKNLSTIIEMFIKNNPSLVDEFELMLKCYRSTMSLESEQMVENLHNFNKSLGQHFKHTNFNLRPELDTSLIEKVSDYPFLDINAFKRAHYTAKLKFIDHFCRYRPVILKMILSLEKDQKHKDIIPGDTKFFIKIHKEMLNLVDKDIIYNDLQREFHRNTIKSLYNSLLRRKLAYQDQLEIISFYRNKFYDKFNIELDHVIFKNKIRILLEEYTENIKKKVSLMRFDDFENMSTSQQQILLAKEAEKLRKKKDCDAELNEKAISIFVEHLRDIQYSISATAGRTSKIAWSPNNKLNIQYFIEEAIGFLQTSNLPLAMCEVLKLYLCGFSDRKLFKNTDIKIANKKKKNYLQSEKYQEYTKTGDPYFRFIGQRTLKRIDLAIVRLVDRYEVQTEHLKMYSSISSNIVELFKEEHGKSINLDSNIQPTIPFNCDELAVDLLEKHNLLKEIKEKYSQTQIFFILKLLKELLTAREVYNKNLVKIKSVGVGKLEDILAILNNT